MQETEKTYKERELTVWLINDRKKHTMDNKK